MNKDKIFKEELKKETDLWIAEGIIDTRQKNSILQFYQKPDNSPVKRKDKSAKTIHLSHVTAALAALCLAVGLIIFYAANWRKMPPSLKLIQVFGLITAAYGISFYFYMKNEIPGGRIFLNLGMVSFGIGIMLVAQIYHISAHPTKGLLIWAAATAAMSALMKERPGYYMASLLFFIWNCWELFEYQNPAYSYIIAVLILGWLFYRIKDRPGIVLSSILTAWYFFQVNIYWIIKSPSPENASLIFILLLLPLGIVLMLSGKIMMGGETLRPAGYIVAAGGLVSFMVPFLGLSWPYNIKDISVPASFQAGTLIQTWEYIIFLIIAAALIRFIKLIQEPAHIYIPLLAAAALFFFLPPGDTTVRMISTHLAITVLSGLLLLLAYKDRTRPGFERGAAFVFAVTFLIIKFYGFMIYSQGGEYRIAYLSGFILFGTVFFLINRTVAFLTSEKGDEYPERILDTICAVLAWIAVYSASLKTDIQKSIFEADRVVIVMIMMFLIISIALYAYLLIRLRKEKIMIYLSMVIFIFTGVILFASGPGISWIVYSLIFNLLLLLFSGTLIYYSTVIQSRVLLNAGITAFVIHLGTRYFDLFWDMLSGSLLFITTGIIGLAGGYILEKKRRQLMILFDREQKHSPEQEVQ